MKTQSVLSVVVLTLVSMAAPSTNAQQHPDFTGTWKLVKQDPPPRTGGRGGERDARGGGRALESTPSMIVITQSANAMAFESTTGSAPDPFIRKLEFNLDFEITINPLPPGADGGEPRLNGPTKTRGRWMADGLYLHLTQGLGQRRDILTLNDGVLQIRRDYETPGGSGTISLTFNKVS